MILFAYLCKLPNSRKTFEYIITYKSYYILQYFYISQTLLSTALFFLYYSILVYSTPCLVSWPAAPPHPTEKNTKWPKDLEKMLIMVASPT